IWVLASMKFLIPFSVVAAAARTAAEWTSSAPADAMTWLSPPLRLWNLDGVAASGEAPTGPSEGVRWLRAVTRLAGAAALSIWRWRQWRRVTAIVAAAEARTESREACAIARITRTAPDVRSIPVRHSDSTIEPSIVGVFRPRLLWPDGLSERL